MIGVLIAVLFIFLLPRLWKQPPVQEGAVSAEDVLHIIDADLCYGSKCLGTSSEQRKKMINELNISIYDNNLDFKALSLKNLGLNETELPFKATDLENAVFSIEYQYGGGSGSQVYDLSVNMGKPLNLANYRYGPLVITDATYCYTDSSGNPGITSTLGEQHCIPKSENLVKKLNSMIENNTLVIDKISPQSLGNVMDPYTLMPNYKTIHKSSENAFDISYAYGSNATVFTSLFDGNPFSTSLPNRVPM